MVSSNQKVDINTGEFIGHRELQAIGVVCVVIASLFIVARFALRAWKKRLWAWEDSIIFLAWSCFFALCVAYICVVPVVYKIEAVGKGLIPIYPTFFQDGQYMLRILFPGTMLLWITLWLVKISLLIQCRRLVDKQKFYMKIWWVIFGVTVILFWACLATEFTSCRSLHDWLTFGQCNTARDAKAAIISLFFSYGADILTDLAIIIFPIRVIAKLQLDRIRKISVMGVFAVGTLCIVAATVRVVSITAATGSAQPSPNWLILWGMVETCIAIIVSTLPTFGILLPVLIARSTGNSQSHAKRYGRSIWAGSNNANSHTHKVSYPLNALGSESTYARMNSLHEVDQEATSSQDNLNKHAAMEILELPDYRTTTDDGAKIENIEAGGSDHSLAATGRRRSQERIV